MFVIGYYLVDFPLNLATKSDIPGRTGQLILALRPTIYHL
jgi:hypothetical protein